MNADLTLNDVKTRNAMMGFVRKRLSNRDPEDILHNAIVRSIQALGVSPSPAYLWRALRSEIIDTIRRDKRELVVAQSAIRDPDIANHPEFLACLTELTQHGKIPEVDPQIIMKRIREGRTNEEGWNAADRKRYSRLKMRVAARVFLKWFAERDYVKINAFRLPISWMKEVALLAVRQGIGISCFQEAFDHPQLSPTIQNATWALRTLAHQKPSVVGFFEEQVRKNHLFRGNTSYIFETLTVLDPVNFMELYRRSFLPNLRDLPSRAIPDTRPFREQEAFQQRCIVDVVPYVPITTGIPLAEIQFLKLQFMDGTDDVDFRRSLTWQMLRLRPQDGGTMETVINSLSDEHDQINAYYIVKFIMGPGLDRFPEILLSQNTCNKIRAVAHRWPQNSYFSESAARVAIKLKTLE